jgi:hypothetical protein
MPGQKSTRELRVFAPAELTASLASMSNKRRTSRQAINAAAWLEIDNDTRLRRCKLVDISANGARLFVDDIENTPDTFNLLLSRFGRPNYRCNVVWRRGDELGVEFLAANDTGSSADPPARS